MAAQNANDNIAVVRRLYEARGDPEIIRQVLAPDVRWEVVEGFPYGGVYLGLNGVSDFFTRLFTDFADWRTEPSEFFESGDHVIAIGAYSGRAKVTGKTFKARFAHVWTMRNGVIARLQQVADTAQLARALESDAHG
jgi:ketosteroid isomerase-like protein